MDMLKKLEAVEIWFIRKMIMISYTQHVTNEEVIRSTNTIKKLLNEIVNRQVKFFGHIMRKVEVETLVMTSFVKGKKARDRKGNLPYVPE